MQLSGDDPRHIEEILNDLNLRMRIPFDHFERSVKICRAEGCASQQVNASENGSQRRPQFVRKGGEEDVLRGTVAKQFFVCHPQLARLFFNAAFQFGSQGLAGDEALAHGFELLALTVKDLTGISPDAGAIIDFPGFQKVVQVLGKVCMYVDEDTTSIHAGHTADGKPAAPYVINPDGTVNHRVKGVTANFYAKGDHCFTPADALDFVRQRDLLADHDYDYGRQRHQQQFVKAVLAQAVHDGLSSPAKLPGLVSAIGQTMTVDPGGVSLEDWAFAMRGINPAGIVTVRTNAGRFNSRSVPGVGSVEIVSPTSLALLRAARTDTVAQFAAAHPSWIAHT